MKNSIILESTFYGLVSAMLLLGFYFLILNFVSQYQTELFWAGVLANLAGIIYMAKNVLKVNSSIIKQNEIKDQSAKIKN